MNDGPTFALHRSPHQTPPFNFGHIVMDKVHVEVTICELSTGRIPYLFSILPSVEVLGVSSPSRIPSQFDDPTRSQFPLSPETQLTRWSRFQANRIRLRLKGLRVQWV